MSLTSGTAYEFYVRDDCSGDYSSWAGPFTFTTLSDYCGGDHFYDSGGSSGQYSNNEDITTSICPDNAGDVVTAIFNAFNTESGWDFLEVHDGNNTSATSLGSFSGTSIPGPFTSTDASGCLTFHFTSDGFVTSNGWDVSITCAAPPSCNNPSSPSVSNITSTSAEANWNAGIVTTEYNWEVVPSGNGQGVGVVASGNTSTTMATISGLTTSTSYDFYVKADCESNWVGPVTFTTVPANDECSGAISLTVGANGDCPTNQYSADATSATQSDDELVSCDGFGNIGVWFEFTAPASGGVIVNYSAVTATGAPGLVVFDACGGTEVSGTCQNNPSSFSNITGLTGGNTYKLLIWFDSGEGSFDICLEDLPSCENPTNPSISNITSTGAEASWTAGIYTSMYDWEVVPAGNGQGVGVIANGNTSSTMATISGLTASTDYDFYVKVDCESNWVGPIQFTTLAPPPANDECAGAIALTVNVDLNCGSTTTGTTEGATASSQTNDVTGTPNNDVWYSFVATATSHQIALQNVVNQGGGTSTSTDMGMGLYDGTGGCASLSLVGSSDPDIYNATGLTAGTTYYVRVYGWYSSVQNNNFDICIGTPPLPPANDDCSGAISISESADNTCANSISGTTISATNSSDYSSCSSSYNEVWYVFTPIASTNYFIERTITSGSGSTYLSVWSGSCGSLTQVNSGCYSTSLSDVALTAGTTYYISVATYNTGGVDFDLCVYPAPPPPTNDLCANASQLAANSVGTFNINGSSEYATDTDAPGSSCGTSMSDEGVWIEVIVDDQYDYEFDLCGSDYDTKIGVYIGSCGALTCIDGNDDAANGYCSVDVNQSFIAISATDLQAALRSSGPTRTQKNLYVYISGYSGATGSYDLDVTALTPLPIEIASFTAKAIEKENLIQWSTVSERNNQWMIIERSPDGISKWEEIGRAEGHFNSNEWREYSVIDEQPLRTSYYRIHSLDNDGMEEYSELRVVKREDYGNEVVQVKPVPAKDNVFVTIRSTTISKASFEIRDITGRIIQQSQLELFHGLNEIPFDLGHLNAGVYFIRVNSDLVNETITIVKE